MSGFRCIMLSITELPNTPQIVKLLPSKFEIALCGHDPIRIAERTV